MAMRALILSSVAIAQGAITTRATCDKTSSVAATLELKWNMFSSEWGGYTVTGCDGINPKLQLTAGTTYTFDQSDVSNWYHPVGFAYIAGGAHTECTASDGTVGECPELGGESAGTTIQYYVDGVAVTSDESGFGLDAYEPLFFNSQDWWGEQNDANPYQVTLTIPSDASYTIIYYFCHIHAGMSAEIEIIGSSATSTTVINTDVIGSETQTSAQAIYTTIVEEEQATLSSYDEACGTHNSADYNASHSTCKGKHFLCGDDASSSFAQCLTAVDCQMHHEMAVSMPANTSRFATFARQMIAHHQNAVAMAKVLANFHNESDYPAAGTEDQDMEWAEGLVRNIINVQNFQIQQMQGWLDANPTLAGTSDNCYESATTGSTCREIRAAFKGSSCCGSDLSQETAYTITAI
jgi:uncharacterized protein (DUF305 family)